MDRAQNDTPGSLHARGRQPRAAKAIAVGACVIALVGLGGCGRDAEEAAVVDPPQAPPRSARPT